VRHWRWEECAYLYVLKAHVKTLRGISINKEYKLSKLIKEENEILNILFKVEQGMDSL
jgi:hypothetical protein